MNSLDRQLLDPALQRQLDAFLADPSARIRPLTHDGSRVWAKKCETLSLRWRIQKGDPMKAFRADVDGHHALAAAGVPVPRILAEGNNFIVTEDCGQPLSDILARQDGSKQNRVRAFTHAGKELALLHGKGLTHGRPAIKDICWDGERLVFLDFERYAPARNTPEGHMRDLIMLIHSCYVYLPRQSDEADAAAAAYRAHDTGGIWDLASTWCRKMRWIDWATKPLQWGNRVGATEFKAIPLALRAFGAL